MIEHAHKELLYDKQYEHKIPFFLTFLTGPGLIAILIAFFLTKNLINFGALSIFLSFLVYKFISPPRTEIEEIFLIKLFYNTAKKIKHYVFFKKK